MMSVIPEEITTQFFVAAAAVDSTADSRTAVTLTPGIWTDKLISQC